MYDHIQASRRARPIPTADVPSTAAELMVVGTFAVGMTIRLMRLPVMGETLMGEEFDLGPGGKGANMATAAARQGVSVGMVATVGGDDFGAIAFRHFEAEGIDATSVRRKPGATTHVGMALLMPDGRNAIVGYAGASAHLTAEDVRMDVDRIRRAKVLIVEFGAPDEAIAEAVEIARDAATVVICNPAPARAIAPGGLTGIDFLTPNETEARIILGLEPDDRSTDAATMAASLRARGARTVVVTLGEHGCVVDGPDGAYALPRYPAATIDTVGAGDAFNGGLAAGLIRGLGARAALEHASGTAALSTAALGAVDGLPTLAELLDAMAAWGNVPPT